MLSNAKGRLDKWEQKKVDKWEIYGTGQLAAPWKKRATGRLEIHPHLFYNDVMMSQYLPALKKEAPAKAVEVLK